MSGNKRSSSSSSSTSSSKKHGSSSSSGGHSTAPTAPADVGISSRTRSSMDRLRGTSLAGSASLAGAARIPAWVTPSVHDNATRLAKEKEFNEQLASQLNTAFDLDRGNPSRVATRMAMEGNAVVSGGGSSGVDTSAFGNTTQAAADKAIATIESQMKDFERKMAKVVIGGGRPQLNAGLNDLSRQMGASSSCPSGNCGSNRSKGLRKGVGSASVPSDTTGDATDPEAMVSQAVDMMALKQKQQAFTAMISQLKQVTNQLVPVNDLVAGATTLTAQFNSMNTDERFPTGHQMGMPWQQMYGTEIHQMMRNKYVRQSWKSARDTRLMWLSGHDPLGQNPETSVAMDSATNPTAPSNAQFASMSKLLTTMMAPSLPMHWEAMAMDTAGNRVLVVGNRVAATSSQNAIQLSGDATATTATGSGAAATVAPKKAGKLWEPAALAFDALTEAKRQTGVNDFHNGIQGNAVVGQSGWVGQQTLSSIAATVSESGLQAMDIVLCPSSVAAADGTKQAPASSGSACLVLMNVLETRLKTSVNKGTALVVRLLPNGTLDGAFSITGIPNQYPNDTVVGVRLLYSPKRDRAFVLVQQDADNVGASVCVLDGKTGELVDLLTFPTGVYGTSMALSDDETILYTAGSKLAPDGSFRVTACVSATQVDGDSLKPIYFQSIPSSSVGTAKSVTKPNTVVMSIHALPLSSAPTVGTASVLAVGHAMGDYGNDATSTVVWYLDAKGQQCSDPLDLDDDQTTDVVTLRRTVMSDDRKHLWMTGQTRRAGGWLTSAETTLMHLDLEQSQLESFRLPSIIVDQMSDGRAITIDPESGILYVAGSMQMHNLSWFRQSYISATNTAAAVAAADDK